MCGRNDVVKMFLIRSAVDGRKVVMLERSAPEGWRCDVCNGGIVWWGESGVIE